MRNTLSYLPSRFVPAPLPSGQDLPSFDFQTFEETQVLDPKKEEEKRRRQTVITLAVVGGGVALWWFASRKRR
jgi:hypothetical protein